MNDTDQNLALEQDNTPKNLSDTSQDNADQVAKVPTESQNDLNLSTVANNDTPNDPPPLAEFQGTSKKFKINKGIFILLGVVFTLLIGLASFFILLAYGKLPLNNKNLEKTARNIVQGIPFMPKTPEYIIERTVLAHSTLTSGTYDISIAAKTSAAQAFIGTSDLEMQFTGSYDVSDIDNVIAETAFRMKPNIEINAKTLGYDLYFQVVSLPPEIDLMMQSFIGQDLSFMMGQWFHYKLDDLKTKAGENLQNNSESDALFNEQFEDALTKLLDEELKQHVVMGEADHNGKKVYTFSLDLTGEELEKIIRKWDEMAPDDIFANENVLGATSKRLEGNLLSDSPTGVPTTNIEKFTAKVYIDKNDYFLRHVSTFFSYNDDSYNSLDFSGRDTRTPLAPLSDSNEKIEVSAVLELDNFGNPPVVTAPADFKEIEWLYDQFSSNSILNPSAQTDYAKVAARKSLINKIALQASSFSSISENNKYPSLEVIVFDMGIDIQNVYAEKIYYLTFDDNTGFAVFSALPSDSNPDVYFLIIRDSESNFSRDVPADELVSRLKSYGVDFPITDLEPTIKGEIPSNNSDFTDKPHYSPFSDL